MQQQKITAVIFDLDGTIIDSEPNYYEADRKVLADHGIPYTMKMKEKYVGMGNRAMMEDLHRQYQFEASVDELLLQKNKYYQEIARGNTVVYPEMGRFLEILRQQRYPMALASGSSPEIIEMVLDITGLSRHFEVVISAEEVPRGKPAPDIFLEAAARLQVSPEDCLVVEDSQYGVEAAHRAGMYCIGVPYLTDQPLPESFQRVNLLFPEGMGGFTADKAYRWLTGGAR
jgi:beta-phosphoglucomutase family hydrolase